MIDIEWVMRMDVDEYIELDLIVEFFSVLVVVNVEIFGFYIRCKYFFWGSGLNMVWFIF